MKHRHEPLSKILDLFHQPGLCRHQRCRPPINNLYNSPEQCQYCSERKLVPVHRYRKVMLPFHFSSGYRIKISKRLLSIVFTPRSRWTHALLNSASWNRAVGCQVAPNKNWFPDLYKDAPSSADAETASGSSKPLWTFSLADLMPKRYELAKISWFLQHGLQRGVQCSSRFHWQAESRWQLNPIRCIAPGPRNRGQIDARPLQELLPLHSLHPEFLSSQHHTGIKLRRLLSQNQISLPQEPQKGPVCTIQTNQRM